MKRSSNAILIRLDGKIAILTDEIHEADWCLRYLFEKTRSDIFVERKFYNYVHEALNEYKRKRSISLHKAVIRKENLNKQLFADIEKIDESRNADQAQ
jgi:hypothetical protein